MVKNIFFNGKGIKFFNQLPYYEEWYMLEAEKKTKYTLTYPQLIKHIYMYDAVGLITTRKKQRVRLFKLTKKGKKLQDLFKELEVLLEHGVDRRNTS